jgi:hypothetical protein
MLCTQNSANLKVEATAAGLSLEEISNNFVIERLLIEDRDLIPLCRHQLLYSLFNLLSAYYSKQGHASFRCFILPPEFSLYGTQIDGLLMEMAHLSNKSFDFIDWLDLIKFHLQDQE